MKRYKVLWVEDQPKDQDGIEDDAYLEGIDLVNFITHKDGMDELRLNKDSYDAIVLDAKGYNKSVDEKTTLSGLHFSIKTINELCPTKPYFIFSAYMDKDENSSAREILETEEILTKVKDNQKLFNRIKEEANKQQDTQIRHENSKVFEALKDFDEDASETLLKILKAMKYGGNDLDKYFTSLRKIVEDLFRACNKFGLLPDEFVRNGVALNESSKFLSGKTERGFTLNEAHFGSIISDNVRNILSVTQPSAHRSHVDKYLRNIGTPYLLYSITFQILDVIIWFKKYVDSHPKKENWVESVAQSQPIIETGIIEQDESRYYHCGLYILGYTHTEANFNIGDRIRITHQVENTDIRSNRLYPQKATKFEKI